MHVETERDEGVSKFLIFLEIGLEGWILLCDFFLEWTSFSHWWLMSSCSGFQTTWKMAEMQRESNLLGIGK